MDTISNNRVFDWYRHYKQEETIDSIESRLTNESMREGLTYLEALPAQKKKEKKKGWNLREDTENVLSGRNLRPKER